MSTYDKTSIQINRCKRILALVDDYMEKQDAATRTDLRKALMEEFEAPAIAPPVAAGSVDTPEFSALAARYGNSKAGKDYMALIANADAWGAQQREAGALVSLQDYDAACDKYRKQIAALTGRAEKAEAERNTLKESLQLVNEDHGLWMARTHAAEDARDDALARAKELEARVEKLGALHGALGT